MNPLHWMIRRGHCRGTHQNLALDALPLVETAAGKRLVSWLLRYYPRYLRGAIDPDVRFRDFQNQVIHVPDGYWGGAPRVAHQWYDRLQRYLRQQRYSDAAHAAGVLSHYFTDPIQPLNTAYSEAEAIIHRPLEWSIDHAYDEILRHWYEDELRVVFQFADGPGWLGAAMLHSAKYAHQRFDVLVQSYRLDAALKDPAAGLTSHLRLVLAELFGLAITGWARVLERAASDAEAVLRRPLPTASSGWPTLTAALRIPGVCWRNRIQAKLEEFKVQELVDEFRRTGSLQEHLPASVDIKRRVIKIYRDERRYRLQRQRSGQSGNHPAQRPVESTDARQRPGLALRGRVVDCLAIDLHDLTRLKGAEIETLDDLQAEPAERIAARIRAYWITAQTVSLWQRQASLMTQVTSLDGTAAMILSGAGYHDPGVIAATEQRSIVDHVFQFLQTVDGRRCLQGRPQPTRQKIVDWLRIMQTSVDHSPQVTRWKLAS